MAAIAAFSAAPCFALPDGARVRGGGIEFSNPDPATLQIRQQQRRGAVDFNSFNIRANERVLIQQPDAKSLFLGRVVGGLGPSKIDGLLKANGGVILLNPQGLLIGPSGSVNTASFMASTLDANPEQFLSGGPLRLWKPTSGPAEGQILNQGSISVAEGGLAALVGANISNEGLISARMGTVVLASGQSATLDVNGDGLITLAVSDEVLNSLINQQGTIQAPGGAIWIGASHLGGALTSVVNVGGLVQANSVEELLDGEAISAPAGAITVAGKQVKLQGTLEAQHLIEAPESSKTAFRDHAVSAADASVHLQGVSLAPSSLFAQGQANDEVNRFYDGTIDVLGDQIELVGAVLSVSGTRGGGRIRIGGDQRGVNPQLLNAKSVLIDQASSISADAIDNGDGGRVIVWSDERTDMHGTITARGGANGGNGGFVETSSAKLLNVTGRVSTAAPKGQAGQWLLDPEEVTITSTEEAATEDTPPEEPTPEASSTDIASTTEESATAAPTEATSTISAESLQQAVNEGSTVTVEAKGEIQGAEAISTDQPSSGSLVVAANQANTAQTTSSPSPTEPLSQAAPAPEPEAAAPSTTAADDDKEAETIAQVEQATELQVATQASAAQISTPAAPTASITPIKRLYLDGLDLTIDQASALNFAGQNLVIEACSTSCNFANTGNITLSGFTGLNSLEVLAPTRIEIRGDISVAQKLNFQGNLFLAAPSIRLSAAEIEIAKPIQVALDLGQSSQLQITTSAPNLAIQVGAPQPSAAASSPALTLSGTTLEAIKAAPVSQLTIGDAAHTGSIVVHEVLQSGQNLSLISGGNIEVGKAATLSAAQSVELAGSSVDIQGVIRANDGLKGGAITVVGNAINLGSTAVVDATGATAGGLIQIGGSWQNSNPAVRQAITTTIAQGALLDASALQRGDGGTVVAWSDIQNPQSVTTVSGTLLARGGTAGGNGGRIETSGYDLKVDDIRVDTTAAAGETGLWLLDPYNITIKSATQAGVDGSFTATADSAVVDDYTLTTALNSSNVTVRTGGAGSAGTQAGDITVATNFSSSTANKLTLDAYRNIILTNNITRSGAGGLELKTTTGAVTGSGAISISAGGLTFNVGGTNLGGALTSSTHYSGVISGSGAVTMSGTGTQTLSGNNTYTGGTVLNSGIIGVYSSNALSSSGTISFRGGTLLYANSTDNSSRFNTSTGSNAYKIDIPDGRTVTWGATLTGDGSITKLGAGTLTLTGSNTNTGTTTIQAGTLQVGSNASFTWGAIGSGAVINNGTLTINRAGPLTFDQNISGTGSVVIDISGQVTLTGSNTYSGGTTIKTGNIEITAANALGTGIVNMTSALNNLNLNSSNNLTITNEIIGIGVVNQRGSGTTILEKPSYTGATNIYSGGLQINLDKDPTFESQIYFANGTGSVAFNNPSNVAATISKAITTNGTPPMSTVNIIGSGDMTFQKAITASSLTQNGTGTTTLLEANTITNTTINAGTLQLGVGESSSAGVTGSITNNANLVWNRGDSALTIGNTLGGTGSTTINTTGALTIAGSGLTGSNLTLNTASLTLNSPITATGRISITTNNPTQSTTGLSGSGKITASELMVISDGPVMPSGLNDVDKIAISTGRQITFKNEGALTVGTVGSLSGITSTERITVTTDTGDLTLSAPVKTTSTSNSLTAPALLLNAGVTASAGVAVSGDIIVAAGGSANVGSGGTGLLYSGRYANQGSSYLDALVGSTTSLVNLRFNSDEVTKNYTAPVGTGLTAIYRQDVVFVVAPLTSTVYGNLPVISENTLTYRNSNYQLVSGAALGTITGTATWQFNGAKSTSNNAVVGTSPLVYVSGLTNDLGKVLVNDPNNRFAITPKALTISGITAADKVYDGNTTATVSTAGVAANGIVTGDVVTVNATGSFTSKNVASGQTVNLTSSTGGDDAANYSITGQSTTTASITARTVTLSASKVYDGNTDLTGDVTITTGVATETLTYSGATASDSHVTTAGKTISAITLANGGGGGLAANYVLPTLNATNAPVTITAAPVTASLNNTSVSKIYDGSTSATDFVPSWQLSGLLNGDTATLSYSAAYNNANVLGASQLNLTNLALASISATSGAFSSDYQLSTSSLNLNASITPKALSISGTTAAGRAYDGTTTATITPGTLSGFVGNETVALASATGVFDSKDAGARTATATYVLANGTNGGLASNYSLAPSTGLAATITAKTVSLSASKVYNGSTDLTGAVSIATGVSGETLTYSGATASDSHVATTGKFISAISLANGSGGGLATNYVLPALDATNAAVTITAAPITASLNNTSASKIYDGTTSASGFTPSWQLSGFAAGDSATISYSAAYNNANVVGANQLNLTSLALATITGGSGTLSDYQLNTSNLSLSASITPATISAIGGLVAQNKVYNQTNTATLDTSGATFTGRISNDQLAINSYAAQFASENVSRGTGGSVQPQTVTASGFTLTGASASNYQLAQNLSVNALSANITPKPLTISGITAADKTYDGNTNAAVSTAGVTNAVLVSGGMIAGDDITVSATGSFASKDVASTPLNVNLTSSYGGADLGNYTITSQPTTTASITARTVTLSASKVYDGSTDLTGDVTITTGVNGETLSYSGATASDSHVATAGKFISAITLADGSGGGLAANYVLPTLNSTNAAVTITAAPVTAALTNSSASKIYDGTTTATSFVPSWQFSGLLTGDTAALSYSAAYNNANVVGANQLNLTGLSLSSITGGNGALSDYQLTTSSLNLNASITPKALSISGTTAAGRAYDGTTTATITPGTLSDFVGNETVTLASATGVFDGRDAGARTATATYALADGNNGGLASNYSLAPTTGLTATIAPRTVTLSASKTYNGSTDLTGAVTITTGVSGETLTYSGATASNSHVATTGKFISAISLANGSGGGLATNYVLPALDATNAAVTITAAPITATLTNSSATKIYDGSTSATDFVPSWQISGLVSGDSATLSYTAAYNNANVVGASQLNVSNLSLASITGGSGALSDYQLNTTSLSLNNATITPKALTITNSTAAGREYDGTTTAVITPGTITGFEGNQTVTLASATGVFDSKNVGARTATATYVLANGTNGELASNYSLAPTTGLTATITAKALTISGITAANKTYDGTTDAIVSTAGVTNAVLVAGGMVNGDVVTVSATGSFASKDVASTPITVNLTSSYGGADLGNYTITSQPTTTASITARTVTLSASKTYNGSTDLTGAVTITTGVIGETLSYSGATASDSHVATAGKFISAITLANGSGGELATNYVLPTLNATNAAVTITAAPITATLTNSSATKIYDGTTAANGFTPSWQLLGFASGDSATLSYSAAYNNANVVGANQLNLSSLALASISGGSGSLSDYQLNTSSLSLSASITPATISAIGGLVAQDKVYNRTNTATLDTSGATFTGRISNDQLAINSYAAQFASENVSRGAGDSVQPQTVTASGFSLTGASASNYQLAQNLSINALSASITPKALTITNSAAAGREYNGTTTAVITPGTITGFEGNQTVTLASATGVFDSKNIGARTATATYVLANGTNGELASNYSLAPTTGLTATITAKALTISGITAADKTYDGTANATVSTAGVTNAVLVAGGMVNGDVVTVSATGSFASKNVASTPLNVNLTSSYGGADVGNYAISSQPTTTASITARTVTLSASKVYDGSTDLTGDVTITTGVNGETLSYSGATASDSHVATAGKFISAITLANGSGGELATNYVLPTLNATNAAVTITAAPITAALTNASATKIYDGTTAATGFTPSWQLLGFASGDSATINYSAAYNNANVVGASQLNLSSLALASISGGSGSLSDYQLNTSSLSLSASITPATISAIGGLVAQDKVYNRTNTATLDTSGATFTGRISNDQLAIAIYSAQFASENVSRGAGGSVQPQTVTASGFTLTGTSASNYQLATNPSINALSASITPKALTITNSAAAGREYDGTTTAVITPGTITGFVGSETVALATATGVFDSKDAGARTATATYVLTDGSNGGLASNYSLAQSTGLAATIAPKTVTLSATKVYNGSTDLAGAVTIATGVSGETLTYSGATASNSHVATTGKFINAITLADGSGGGLATNYVLPTLNATNAAVTITAAPVTASLNNTSASKIYDGTTAGTGFVPNWQLSGLVSGDSATLSYGAAYNNANVVGASQLNLTSIALASITGGSGALSDYQLNTTSLSLNDATITPKALTITNSTAAGREYNGTTTATITPGTLTGFEGNQTVNLASTTGVFDSKNVGARTATATYVLADGNNGGLGSNYSLAPTTGLTATITAKALTISGITAADKTYDGTTDATVSTAGVTNAVLVSGGMIAGDDVTLDATGTFSDSDVGTAKSVTLTSTYGGTDYLNYLITDQASATASILPLPVSDTGGKPVLIADQDMSIESFVTLSSGVQSTYNTPISIEISTGEGSIAFTNLTNPAFTPIDNDVAGQGLSTIALVIVPNISEYTYDPSQIGIAAEIAYPSLNVNAEIAADGSIQLQGPNESRESQTNTQSLEAASNDETGLPQQPEPSDSSESDAALSTTSTRPETTIKSSEVILVEPDGDIRSTGDGTPRDQQTQAITPLQDLDAIGESVERPEKDVIPGFLRAVLDNFVGREKISSLIKSRLGRIATADKINENR
ncbi:MAG: hypothetical protein RLZZ54_645 [Cyanobacteriota bacterium]